MTTWFRRFRNRREQKQESIRIVALNDHDFNATKKYSGNKIITSKYSALTFIPLNLFEQFHRFANLYFLFMIFLQCIPQISPLNPITSILPLLFVLSVTAVKDGVDDLRRHRSDKKVNKRKVTIIRNGIEVSKTWEDVVVGDIVVLRKNDAVTADMVVLLTSEPSGFCLIETAELDGETNLKVRQAPDAVAKGLPNPVQQIATYRVEVHCEPPNNNLHSFEGVIYLGPKSTGLTPQDFPKISLTSKNILLRGCTLRATEWVYGLVIFAGKDTKLVKNSGTKRYKVTSVDVFLNKVIIGIIVAMLLGCAVCTFYDLSWERDVGMNFQIYQPWESFMPEDNIAGAYTIRAILTFFSYFILLSTFVPISLYVSVEVVRLAHSILITWDKDMYHEETDTPTDVKNTSLSEDLGQIQYVFSDKTGSLTQNVMTFKKCSIHGMKYGDVVDEATGHDADPYEEGGMYPKINFVTEMTPDADPTFLFYDNRLVEAIRHNAGNPRSKEGAMLKHYFRLMALCSTVVPSRVKLEDGSSVLSYQAQSPDENALLSAARSFGYVLLNRDAQSLSIAEPAPGNTSRDLKFPLLHLLDFDSERKRMSVIIRDPDDRDLIILYCKGADSTLLPHAAPNQEAILEQTKQHLKEFSERGLRTLVFGMRVLTEEEWTTWKEKCDEASAVIGDRDVKVRQVYNEIERDFTIIGASAIEDKLQDGVPRAIEQLISAGIRMWVLTGDKQETAINIGYSCNLLTANTRLTVISDEDASTPGKVASLLSLLYSEMTGSKYVPPARAGINAETMTSWQRVKNTLPSFEKLLNRISKLFSRQTLIDAGIITNPEHDQQQTSAPIFALSMTGNALDSILPHLHNKKIRDKSGDGQEEECEAVSEDEAAVSNVLDLFIKVAGRCSTVICCRMTPLGKARVVELFRKHLHARTLSIGDGANDVPMIRSANIGVGIVGREGSQAVLASDFAIAQFRFLAKLLLVHGRWSYVRMTNFILYFLYKNSTFTLGHFFYAFYCGGTAQTAFDPLYVGLFNTIYAGIVLGATDQDVSVESMMRFPQLYEVGLHGKLLHLRIVILTFLESVYSATCIFFVHLGTDVFFSETAPTSVELADLRTFSFTLGFTTLCLVTLRCALVTRYWTILSHISLWGCMAIYWITSFGYDPLIYAIFNFHSEYESAQYAALGWGPTWLASLGAIVLAVLPGIFLAFFFRCIKPTLTDSIREMEGDLRKPFIIKSYQWLRALNKYNTDPDQQGETTTLPLTAQGCVDASISITGSPRSTGSIRQKLPLSATIKQESTGYQSYSDTDGFGDLLTGHNSGSIHSTCSTPL